MSSREAKRLRRFFALIVVLFVCVAGPVVADPLPALPPATFGLKLRQSSSSQLPTGHCGLLGEYVDGAGQRTLLVGAQWVVTAQPGSLQAVLGPCPIDSWDVYPFYDDDLQIRITFYWQRGRDQGQLASRSLQLVGEPEWKQFINKLRPLVRKAPARSLADNQLPQGRVLRVRNKVWVQNQGSPLRIAAYPGLTLLDADEILCEDQSGVEIELLSSGATQTPRKARLRAGSESRFILFLGRNLMVLDGWAELETESPYRLESHSCLASLQRGRLLVRATEKLRLATFYLISGELEVDPSPATLRLMEGTQISAAEGRCAPPLPIEPRVVERASSELRRGLAEVELPLFARLSAASGPVHGVRKDGVTYLIQPGHWIGIHQTVETGPGGWAEVEVCSPNSEADVFQLGPSSSLRLYPAGDSIFPESLRRFGRLAAGLIEGAVRWASGSTTGARVLQVGEVLVELKGTEFGARYRRKGATGEILLSRGKLQIHGVGRVSRELQAGQKLSIKRGALGSPLPLKDPDYQGLVPRPRSSRVGQEAQWKVCREDPRFALEVPASWVPIAQAGEALAVGQPGANRQEGMAAVVMVRLVGDIPLERAVDDWLRRISLGCRVVQRKTNFFAGQPSQYLQMTFARDGQRLELRAQFMLIRRELWTVLTQCPEKLARVQESTMARVLSSFRFTRPAEQR